MDRYDSLGVYRDLNKKMLFMGIPPLYLVGILMILFFIAYKFLAVSIGIGYVIMYLLSNLNKKARGSSTEQGDSFYYLSLINYHLYYKNNFHDKDDVFLIIKHLDSNKKIKNKK